MNRVDELIGELAPGGVTYRALGEIAKYSDTRIDANKLDCANFIGVDNLLPDKGGKTDAKYPPNTARLTSYEDGDVLLGNIRPYLKKIWLASGNGGCSGDVLAIRIDAAYRDSIYPEFLYFLMSSEGFFAYNMQHAMGAKMPRGSKDAILNYRVPVPPLEVQREIVLVLDQFTQLEIELKAELEARRCQYEHYRGALLGFTDDVKRIPLSEICETISAGGDLPLRFVKGQPTPSDEFPFPIFSNGTGDAALYGFTDSYRIGKEAVTISARGTIGFHAVRAPKFTPIIRLLTLVPDPKWMSVRFLNYALDATEIGHSGGSIPQLTVPAVKKIMVPVPSLLEQERIVAILDKFDALVNDLTIGLPAELAARRKQYEYYRDRLLTFKEAAA